jgi:hypothetical protein
MFLEPKFIKPLLHKELIIIKCAMLIHDTQLRVVRIIIALQFLYLGRVICWWGVLIQVVYVIVLRINSSAKGSFETAVLVDLYYTDTVDTTTDEFFLCDDLWG